MKSSGCSKINNYKKSLLPLGWKSDNVILRSVAGASRLQMSKSSFLSRCLENLHFRGRAIIAVLGTTMRTLTSVTPAAANIVITS